MAQAAVGILPHLQNAAYRVSDHCGGMLTCANSAGQNLNVPPTYSCEATLFFFVVVFVFYSGLNNCFSGQNLIPVLQQWTIMT